MSHDREYIDHKKTKVYVFKNLTTGDQLVFDNSDSAYKQKRLSDPKHETYILCRNVREPDQDLDEDKLMPRPKWTGRTI